MIDKERLIKSLEARERYYAKKIYSIYLNFLGWVGKFGYDKTKKLKSEYRGARIANKALLKLVKEGHFDVKEEGGSWTLENYKVVAGQLLPDIKVMDITGGLICVDENFQPCDPEDVDGGFIIPKELYDDPKFNIETLKEIETNGD